MKRLFSFYIGRLFLAAAVCVHWGCSSLFYFPDHELHYDPRKFGRTPVEVAFEAEEGFQLYGWFFESQRQPALGTVVQFHGNAQNMSSHYLSLLWIVEHGYNLFSFDYRGYGKSQGKPDQRGTVQDGLAALDQAWKLHSPPGSQFIVYGQSLGGVIAFKALSYFKHRNEVNLVVMDSTFASYKRVARSLLAQSWFTWILSPLAGILVSNEYGIDDILEDNTIPLLVIHDQRDPTVPYSNGQDIFSRNKGTKNFWILNEGLHGGIFSNPLSEMNQTSNRIKFLKFLNSN